MHMPKLTRMNAMRFFSHAVCIGTLGFSASALAAPNDAKVPHTALSTRCIAAAAKFHRINDKVLSAILRVESSYNALAVNHNANGTIDVGIGQVNSIHFKELSGHGIAPGNLLDPCVGTYVAAWHLGRQIKLHGNTWFAIGAYHSVTPYYNSRYQALVFNAMVDMRATPGPKLVISPLKAPYTPQTIVVTP